MTELPVTVTGGRAFFTEGALAWAGRWVHDEPMEIHTHAFVEIAIVIGGAARHRSVAGEQDLQPGDAVLLQPGVWHGYDCQHLRLYNCCFSAELLQRELAWTREDPSSATCCGRHRCRPAGGVPSPPTSTTRPGATARSTSTPSRS